MVIKSDRPDGSKLSVEKIIKNAYENNDQEVSG